MGDYSLFRYPSKDQCPDVATHSPYPDDFTPVHGSRTHTQRRCRTCGYWVMWVPRQDEQEGRRTAPAARYWTPEVVERIREALAAHDRGESVPFIPERGKP